MANTPCRNEKCCLAYEHDGDCLLSEQYHELGLTREQAIALAAKRFVIKAER